MTVPDPAERDLLTQAEDALHSLALRLLGVQPWLDKPYTDLSELTPWTNGIGQQARRAHDLGMAIRKHLGLPHRRATRALGTPPLVVEDVIAAAVAAERERIRQLAIDRDARCPVVVHGDDGVHTGYEQFADLLADPAPAIPAEGTTS